jgi:IS5 family transposase
MDAVLPWDLLLAPILEHYPKPGNGRRPIGALVMLRIYFMQQWYGLSDPAMEDSLYDVESMRRFAGVDMNGVPDETTICKFRHLLEAHGLTEALFDQTKRYLSDRGMMVSEGTIVDATIIHAPSSTKNKEGKRDPEMALREEGQHLAFWHEGPRGQRSEGAGAQRGNHRRFGA